MSQTSSKTGYKRMILQQLSHPLKLRVFLCIAIIVGWYVMFFIPLSEQVTATTLRIDRERKRLATAREVEQLRKSLAHYQELTSAGTGADELMRRVIDHIRSSPLRLINLKPEGSMALGPYLAIGLHLTLDGRFVDIDAFLGWVETDRRPLRIDAIQFAPNQMDPGRLNVQLSLVSLTEKAAAAAKPQAQAVRH
jgi:hypothetical protein